MSARRIGGSAGSAEAGDEGTYTHNTHMLAESSEGHAPEADCHLFGHVRPSPLSLQRRLSYARLRVRCVYVAELQLKRAEEAPAAREHL